MPVAEVTPTPIAHDELHCRGLEQESSPPHAYQLACTPSGTLSPTLPFWRRPISQAFPSILWKISLKNVSPWKIPGTCRVQWYLGTCSGTQSVRILHMRANANSTVDRRSSACGKFRMREFWHHTVVWAGFIGKLQSKLFFKLCGTSLTTQYTRKTVLCSRIPHVCLLVLAPRRGTLH